MMIFDRGGVLNTCDTCGLNGTDGHPMGQGRALCTLTSSESNTTGCKGSEISYLFTTLMQHLIKGSLKNYVYITLHYIKLITYILRRIRYVPKEERHFYVLQKHPVVSQKQAILPPIQGTLAYTILVVYK